MSFHAGRPIRFELYSLAFAGLVVVVVVRDRMATYDKMFTELIKKSETPAVVQENNNSQTVIVESDRVNSILERVKQMGAKDVNGNDISGIPRAIVIDKSSSNSATNATNGGRVPTTNDATSGGNIAR